MNKLNGEEAMLHVTSGLPLQRIPTSIYYNLQVYKLLLIARQ